MSNPTRLYRYMDHATPEQRLIFTRRRKPLILPLIFLALVLYFVILPAFGATVWGKSLDGSSYWAIRTPHIEFVCKFTKDRR